MLLLALSLAAGPDLAEAARTEVARSECRLRDEEAAVTVCGRRDQRQRYQVTDPQAPFDPAGNVKSVMTERMDWIREGEAGVGTCSGIGPGGFTGCMAKEWRRRLQQKGWLVR